MVNRPLPYLPNRFLWIPSDTSRNWRLFPPSTEVTLNDPGAGVGAYSEGNGKDLGHAIEFRTQVEFARRLRNDARIAIALSHISNASLGDENPGAEILSLYYSIPVGSTHHASRP